MSTCTNGSAAGRAYKGKFFNGEGDTDYLQLLDTARRMYDVDPQYQNLGMLYMPKWNGLVEGPTWGAWWIQNSYGPTYCGMPFYDEAFFRFLMNSHDLWFDGMGDGKTSYVWNGTSGQSWIPPDGCLMDCANQTWKMHKQGDGRVDIHDWGMEFTAAGGLMQSELLLIHRDKQSIDHYLPMLERAAMFIESRRDPDNNLFLAGPAGNLLAPSFAGWKRPDGTFDKAYLTGLSITYIAFLDRLIELEKMAGRDNMAKLCQAHRALARKGLPQVTTEEGCFIKSMDPDGTRHGVYGAPMHGYFEASPNHDAICFRVVDEAQAAKIYSKIASIPSLRPHDLIITNCPSLDDIYDISLEGNWTYGLWVNGGHWSTCEARMMMGYYRLGKYDDARKSMKRIIGFADRFRMDNPLINFGSEVYQPAQPINLTYDIFGVPSALIRGLFEYLYDAEGLTIVPHIPTEITRLEQKFPIRFGTKKLYISTVGQGAVSSVTVNGKSWELFDAKTVRLPYEKTPDAAAIQIVLGNGQPKPFKAPKMNYSLPPMPPVDALWAPLQSVTGSDPGSPDNAPDVPALIAQVAAIKGFHERLVKAGLGDTYEAAHARLAVRYLDTTYTRLKMLKEGKLKQLEEERSRIPADKLYLSTTVKLCEGLEKVVQSYKSTIDPQKKRIYALWTGN